MTKKELEEFLTGKIEKDGYVIVAAEMAEQFSLSLAAVKVVIGGIINSGHRAYYFPESVTGLKKITKVLVPEGTTYHSLLVRKDEIFA